MKRLVAALALLSILVLPPLLLMALGFHAWDEVDLLAPADPRLLLGGLTLLGWGAWGVWVLSVGAEALRMATSGRLTLRLPLLGAPQALAAALLTSVLVTSPAAAYAGPAAQAGAATAPAAPGSALREADPRDQRDAVSGAQAPDTHVVRSGDDLWSLAERYYDDGRAWRQIVAANPELQSDPTAGLPEGVVLRIPDPVVLVSVRSGDTLSGLAAQHLGEADRWPEIHRLNRTTVRDPDVIDIGWRLKLPRVVKGPVAPVRPAPPVTAGEGGSPETATLTPRTTPAAQPGLPAALAEPPAGSSVAPQRPPVLAPASDPRPGIALVGGLTSLTAAAVLGGLELRRRVQEHARPLGRRYAQPADALTRVETALGQVRHADDEEPDRGLLIGRAMRHLAHHWRERDASASHLVHAVVGADTLEFVLAVPTTSRPDGFEQVGERLVIAWSTLLTLPDPDAPVAWPALVTLGADDQGNLVMVDVLASGVLGVRGEAGTLASEALSAMLVELACAPWSSDLSLLVVSGDDRFARATSTGQVRSTADVEAAVAELEMGAAERRARLHDDGRGYDAVRLDPLVADAWTPRVAVFELAPDTDQTARLTAAVEDPDCGLAAILPVDAQAGPATWLLTDAGSARTTLPGVPAPLAPQFVPRMTRDAIAALYAVAHDTTTHAAPWWTTEEPDDVNIISLRPALAPTGPYLRLLGPVELHGAAGDPPPRAARQCVEYCAWILLNPGRTALEMTRDLLVADGTRRSNLSRLRTWLGADAQGAPYLPDAYSGRITLHDAVASDWEHLQTLVAHGVNRTPPERLRLALELVRGAPLADAAPGQWHWAEGLRADMAATIRDVGVILARAARERGDLELARWAANRALLAVPDDELLLGERIRTECAGGRPDEVERLVTRLTRHAATLGADLLPESIDLLQEVLEGRRRARA